MMISFLILTLISAVGVVMTTLQTVLTLFFRRRRRFFGQGPQREGSSNPFPRADFITHRPLVSILKPVCGLEDDLRENLKSFTALTGIDYEVILSVADAGDPSLSVIGSVMYEFPEAPFRVVLGGDPDLEHANRKIARLVAAEREARGEILFISDANVRLDPGLIAPTIRMLSGNVGCVSNLFTGSGARTFGATIESLHLLSFVVPGSVLAAFAGVPCVVGKSMALSRRALNDIGGFTRFSNVLAEDQAIGLAVRDAGYEVKLSPHAVRNVVMDRTVRRALDRQIRWNKIRYAFSRPAYSAEFLAMPLPMSLLAATAALVVSGAINSLLIPMAIGALRMIQVATLAWSMRAPLTAGQVLAIPIHDLLHFGAQFVPYFSDRITWRGYSARIGPATVLLPLKKKAA